jgi:hypothetical protein
MAPPGMPTGLRRGSGARSASHNNLLAAFSPVFDLELLELDGRGADGACFDRRWSHLSLGAAGGGATGGGAAARLMALLRGDGSLFTCQLWQELHRLRAAYALPPSAGAGAGVHAPDGDPAVADASTSGSGSDTVMAPAPAPAAAAAPCAGAAATADAGGAGGLSRASSGGGSSAASSRGSLDAGGRLDIEGIARALLAAGYMVQLRDEAPGERPKDVRQCLQQLRHRFIVCTGARGGAGGEHGGGGAPGGLITDAVGDAHYLPEPMVVEPRFREQFVIAQPTPAYEALLEVGRGAGAWGWLGLGRSPSWVFCVRSGSAIPRVCPSMTRRCHPSPLACRPTPPQAVPLCFVGTTGRLDAVVSFICDEMAAAFRQQGLAVPPWRTRTAMLSKWAPQQLWALAAKIAGVRRAAPHSGEACCSAGSGGPGAAGVAAHAQLCCGERPAAQLLVHAAAGSAPAGDSGAPPPLMPALVPAASLAACGAPQYYLPGAVAEPGPPPLAFAGHLSMGPQPPTQQQPHPPQLNWGSFSRGPVAALAAPGAGALPGAAPAPCAPPALPEALAAAPLLAPSFPAAGPPPSSAGGGLKFTRKASAEWKHDRRGGANGKKATSLLAAALKKSGSRGNLSVAAAAAAAAAAVAAADGAPGGAARRQGGAAIRTTPNEAGWGCITTVRWGALHEAPGPGSAAAGSGERP